ncbi:MAG TPA: DUF2069 domain-containing protein [Gammaproteobacteria bacterium]|nr:DUF2069 domain-containing protein [Gammaproteobacteria bacterium]
MMRFQYAGRAPVILVLALMMLWLAVWLGVLVTAGPAQHALWLSLALLPLLIVMLAVWRDMKGGFAWSGFLSLGYLAQGITVVWTGATQTYAGIVEIILSVLMFAAASGALRARRGSGQR